MICGDMPPPLISFLAGLLMIRLSPWCWPLTTLSRLPCDDCPLGTMKHALEIAEELPQCWPMWHQAATPTWLRPGWSATLRSIRAWSTVGPSASTLRLVGAEAVTVAAAAIVPLEMADGEAAVDADVEVEDPEVKEATLPRSLSPLTKGVAEEAEAAAAAAAAHDPLHHRRSRAIGGGTAPCSESGDLSFDQLRMPDPFHPPPRGLRRWSTRNH